MRASINLAGAAAGLDRLASPAEQTGRADTRVDTRVETPLPWILPVAGHPVRLPTRPLRFRPEGFDAAFDATSLFYDCFFLPNCRQVVLLGPPLLNLASLLASIRVWAAPSWLHCPVRVKELNRHAQVWVEVPADTHSIHVQCGLGNRLLLPRPNQGKVFEGRRVLLTLSRDNPIDWILDWVRFHRDLHGADAVLLYDNGSLTYRPDELAQAIGNLNGIAAVRIVEWPFPYGPQGFGGRHWDSDFCQSGALEDARWRCLQSARSVLNCDIDELVLTEHGDSVFAMAEESRRGYLRFHGQWIVAGSEVLSRRHREYRMALPIEWEWRRLPPARKNRCAPKWVAVPSRLPAGAQWKTHEISGIQAWPGSDSRVRYRHFRAINTSWKYPRSACETAAGQTFGLDEQLVAAYEQVRWDC